ncbi:MAG: LysR family transcriptional regulator [Proteobacteria bacterium]|nr:LysR family transcriptional regulator [Pseudomonadota bacterium]
MHTSNLKGLKAFLAVVECGSVTEAANRLALTQSGVSRQLSAIEEEVGFALFDRIRGRLSVSRKGAAFLRHAQRTLDVVENLPRAALAIASGAADRVVIAGTSAVVHGLLPFAVARYINERPGSPPSITMRSLQEIAEIGAQGHFDLIVAPAPLQPRHYDLLETMDFQLCLAAPVDLLPIDSDDVSLVHLNGLPFISLDPFASYQESVVRALTAAGTTVRFTCETSSVVTAARLVALGAGCAFLDPFVARTIAGPKVSLRKTSPAIRHSYSIFAPSNTPIGEETRHILASLRTVVDEFSGSAGHHEPQPAKISRKAATKARG